MKHGGNLFPMANKDKSGKAHIKQTHKGCQKLCQLGNTTNTAKDNKSQKSTANKAYNHPIHSKCFLKNQNQRIYLHTWQQKARA